MKHVTVTTGAETITHSISLLPASTAMLDLASWRGAKLLRKEMELNNFYTRSKDIIWQLQFTPLHWRATSQFTTFFSVYTAFLLYPWEFSELMRIVKSLRGVPCMHAFGGIEGNAGQHHFEGPNFFTSLSNSWSPRVPYSVECPRALPPSSSFIVRLRGLQGLPTH